MPVWSLPCCCNLLQLQEHSSRCSLEAVQRLASGELPRTPCLMHVDVSRQEADEQHGACPAAAPCCSCGSTL